MSRLNSKSALLGKEDYWCEIPAAEYYRGSLNNPNEQPVLHVKLSGFAIGKYPVTNLEFALFMEAGGYENTSYWTKAGWENKEKYKWKHPNYWHDENWNAEDSPVTGVSWWEASAFAKWAGARLPTEAEWEYAAKGTDSRLHPWGDDPATLSLANYAPECEPPHRNSVAVDAYPLNCSVFGCRNMAGNVGEWCLDNSRFDYNGDDTLVDPLFITAEEDDHILRGGCWLHDEEYLRCTSRDYYPPGLRDNIVGLRLCR